MLYAQVIVKQRTNVAELTYAVPAAIVPYIKVGSLVLAPLRKKTVRGMVTGLKSKVPLQLKSAIRELVDIERGNKLSSKQIAIIRRLADYYGASLAEVGFHALNSSPLPSSRSTSRLQKLVYIQAGWEQRKARYADLIRSVGQHSMLFVFAQKLFAQSFYKYCQTNKLEVIYDDSRAGSMKKLTELQSLGQPYIFLTTLQGVFTSLNEGDVIVVDQPEHVGGKFQSRPFMRSRTITRFRSEMEGLSLIFGSILPKVEDMPFFTKGEWQLQSLLKEMDPTTIFNRKGSTEIFVPGLEGDLRRRVGEGERVLLLVLARGWAPALVCLDCGQVVYCKNCGRTTAVTGGELSCRYCGFREKIPVNCPACQVGFLKAVGEGVSQVAHHLKKLFPGQPVLEFSSDQPIYDEKVQIVVATEKIFSLPDVIFDSVIFLSTDRLVTAAELNSLHELLGYLFTFKQKNADILVETYFPDHAIWGVAGSNNLRSFYTEELNARKKYNLPPYGSVFAVIGQGSAKESLLQQATEISQEIARFFTQAEISQSEMEKRGSEQRMQLNIYTKNVPTSKQKTAIREILPPAWHLDIEP